MVLDAFINTQNQTKPFDFIGRTASFLFSSERRNEVIIGKSLKEINELTEILIGILEDIDASAHLIQEDEIEELLKPFILSLEMGRPVLNSLKSLIKDSDDSHDIVFVKTKQLYFKAKESIDTIDKIIFKLQDIKEDKLTSSTSNLSIQSMENLWSDEEDVELKKLFLES